MAKPVKHSDGSAKALKSKKTAKKAANKKLTAKYKRKHSNPSPRTRFSGNIALKKAA